jgi:hypothetical protein
MVVPGFVYSSGICVGVVSGEAGMRPAGGGVHG